LREEKKVARTKSGAKIGPAPKKRNCSAVARKRNKKVGKIGARKKRGGRPARILTGEKERVEREIETKKKKRPEQSRGKRNVL